MSDGGTGCGLRVCFKHTPELWVGEDPTDTWAPQGNQRHGCDYYSDLSGEEKDREEVTDDDAGAEGGWMGNVCIWQKFWERTPVGAPMHVGRYRLKRPPCMWFEGQGIPNGCWVGDAHHDLPQLTEDLHSLMMTEEVNTRYMETYGDMDPRDIFGDNQDHMTALLEPTHWARRSWGDADAGTALWTICMGSLLDDRDVPTSLSHLFTSPMFEARVLHEVMEFTCPERLPLQAALKAIRERDLHYATMPDQTELDDVYFLCAFFLFLYHFVFVCPFLC
jgi:hypothetical protein